MALLCAVVLGAGAGCPKGTPGSLVVTPARIDGSGALVALTDGATVELTRPLQGGHVLFIGAFVRGMTLDSGGTGTIRGELRRGASDSGQPLSAPGPIIVFEERSTHLVALPAGNVSAPTADPGWMLLPADISDLANIPACPNFLPVDIPDQTLYLQVTYTDAIGNSGTAAVKVVPRCTQTDASARNSCLCECHANYTIDRCLSTADAGLSD